MDRIEGETIPRRILRDDEYADGAPAARRRSAATIAARIHAVDRHDAARRSPRMGAARAARRSTGPCSTRSTNRIPAFELGLRWLDGTRPADAAPPDARARRLPQRQLHRRRRRHPRRARLGARPPRRPARGPRLAVREVVALRQRRPARRRVRRRSTSCSPRTQPRADARVDRRHRAVLGRARHVEVGRDLHRPGVHAPERRSCARSSSPRSVAASPRWSGTCSTSSTEVGDDPGPADRGRARHRRARVPRARRHGRDRRPRAVPHAGRGQRARHRRARARADAPGFTAGGARRARPRCSATTAPPTRSNGSSRPRIRAGRARRPARRRCARTCARPCARSS